MQIANLKNLLTALFVLSVIVCPAVGKIIYVNDDASGANDGTSWTDAYTDLAFAIFAAVSGDHVWVAAGEYKPGSHQTDSFDLKTGVAVYGGFPDSGDPNMADRDWETNVTTLSGDIGTVGVHSDNVVHVVYADGVGSTAILDGFTITGGNSLNGGGMYNENSSATIRNCIFSGNTADDTGAGMNNDNSDVTVSGCTFITNTAYAITLGEGAGIYNYQCNPKITDCKFIDNVAESRGGGISNLFSHPTIINCLFAGNSAARGGGIYNSYSSPTITNCTFSTNSASSSSGGGGIDNYSSSSKPTISNCILWGNTAPSYPEIRNENGNPTIRYCDIAGCGGSGGWVSSFGTDGGGNIDTDPNFVNPAGGEFHLALFVSDCIDVGSNSAVPGYIITDLEGTIRILDGDNNDTVIVDMGAYEVLFPWIGTGDPCEPYQIANKRAFMVLATHPDFYGDHFILTADIDLTGEDFDVAVVAPDTDPDTHDFQGTPFSGDFDGNGYVIRNLTITIDTGSPDYLGLFGYAGSGSVIKNLGLETVTIIANDYYVGGLVGENDGTISECYASGSVTGDYYVGGLVGYNYQGTISQCYSSGNVTGATTHAHDLGGLVGYNEVGTISQCYATGSVTAGYGRFDLGGLVGQNSGTVSQCYATGAVSGGDNSYYLGGLVGNNYEGTISQCYSSGQVTGGSDADDLGGLVGYGEFYSSINNCYWDIETSGLLESAGGLGLTTFLMQLAATYTHTGWDFETIWNIKDTQTYPYFQWQDIHGVCGDMVHPYPPGDVNKDCMVNFYDIAIVAGHWLECTATECD
ncbi:MAG: GLUG motif-containing protein [Planctomycetota bacterium]